MVPPFWMPATDYSYEFFRLIFCRFLTSKPTVYQVIISVVQRDKPMIAAATSSRSSALLVGIGNMESLLPDRIFPL
jgi:hypothetical protein